MAAPTRIYLVTIGESDRLVRAAHPSSALMHVAREIARVGVATQEDLVQCLQDGVKVESVKDDQAETTQAEIETTAAAGETAPAPIETKSVPLWPAPIPRAVEPAAQEPEQAPPWKTTRGRKAATAEANT